MVRVKICGITNERDALAAVGYGAWALGFVFYRKSPRYVSPAKAKAMIACLPPFVTVVGVFVNEHEDVVKHTAEFCRLHALQFHGDEPPSYCQRLKRYKTIKAFGIKDRFDLNNISRYPTHAYLLDTFHDQLFGGSGRTFDWDMIRNHRRLGKPVILSGGLTAQNIAYAISKVNPYAVDVSSGVELSLGRKDRKLIKKFLKTISLLDRQ